MPTFYNELTPKEKHFNSLQASEAIAKYAREVAIERDWPYEKAANYIRAKHPKLSQLEKTGEYDEERGDEYYEYSSHEAGNLIAEKAEALMKSEQLPYETALKKVYADPSNAEIMKCYAAAD